MDVRECPGKLYRLQLGAPGITLVNVMFSQPYYNAGNGKLDCVATIDVIVKCVTTQCLVSSCPNTEL